MAEQLYNVVITYRGGRRETFSNVTNARATELEQNFDTDPDVLMVEVESA
jgi:hypothetical protein